MPVTDSESGLITSQSFATVVYPADQRLAPVQFVSMQRDTSIEINEHVVVDVLQGELRSQRLGKGSFRIDRIRQRDDLRGLEDDLVSLYLNYNPKAASRAASAFIHAVAEQAQIPTTQSALKGQVLAALLAGGVSLVVQMTQMGVSPSQAIQVVFTASGSIIVVGTAIAIMRATMAGVETKLRSVFGVPLEREQLSQIPPIAKPPRKQAAPRKTAAKKKGGAKKG